MRFVSTLKQLCIFPAGIYLFKVNNRNTRARCETCSKFTPCSTIVNIEQLYAEKEAISCQCCLPVPSENRKHQVNIVFNTVLSTITTG